MSPPNQVERSHAHHWWRSRRKHTLILKYIHTYMDGLRKKHYSWRHDSVAFDLALVLVPIGARHVVAHVMAPGNLARHIDACLFTIEHCPLYCMHVCVMFHGCDATTIQCCCCCFCCYAHMGAIYSFTWWGWVWEMMGEEENIWWRWSCWWRWTPVNKLHPIHILNMDIISQKFGRCPTIHISVLYNMKKSI